MTNQEILQASLLDIIFDKRNKDYGAYALRKSYNKRLILSMITALILAFLFLMLASFNKRNGTEMIPIIKKDSVIIHTYEIPPPPKPKEPEKPKIPNEPVKPLLKSSQTKFTSKMVIRKDNLVKVTQVPVNAELKKAVISTQNVMGEKNSIAPTTEIKKSGNGPNTTNETENDSGFIPRETAPEFPGGPDALARFLKINLITPEELQIGEKKTVQVRYKVGDDGFVSNVEIVKSGGELFDKEVIRVCKKMPRWKPANQNGKNIAVFYILPVTFIGVEQ